MMFHHPKFVSYCGLSSPSFVLAEFSHVSLSGFPHTLGNLGKGHFFKNKSGKIWRITLKEIDSGKYRVFEGGKYILTIRCVNLQCLSMYLVYCSLFLVVAHSKLPMLGCFIVVNKSILFLVYQK